MSIITPISNPVPQVAPAEPADELWRLSIDQYHAMIREGILTEDDPVELLEGLLIRKMSKKPPHSVVTCLVRKALERLVQAGWHVNTQEPITCEDSEPEPDVKVVRGAPRDYLNRHPGPQDVALVVEVTDSSLAQDRGIKKRLYAGARIPVYWIVNLLERQIEVYTDPSGPAEQPDYGRRQDFHAADKAPLVIEGREIGQIAVADLLP
jgi:Uma2 family endonuclease